MSGGKITMLDLFKKKKSCSVLFDDQTELRPRWGWGILWTHPVFLSVSLLLLTNFLMS